MEDIEVDEGHDVAVVTAVTFDVFLRCDAKIPSTLLETLCEIIVSLGGNPYATEPKLVKKISTRDPRIFFMPIKLLAAEDCPVLLEKLREVGINVTADKNMPVPIGSVLVSSELTQLPNAREMEVMAQTQSESMSIEAMTKTKWVPLLEEPDDYECESDKNEEEDPAAKPSLFQRIQKTKVENFYLAKATPLIYKSKQMLGNVELRYVRGPFSERQIPTAIKLSKFVSYSHLCNQIIERDPMVFIVQPKQNDAALTRLAGYLMMKGKLGKAASDGRYTALIGPAQSKDLKTKILRKLVIPGDFTSIFCLIFAPEPSPQSETLSVM